jgi:ketosteroid isomerase-like protein
MTASPRIVSRNVRAVRLAGPGGVDGVDMLGRIHGCKNHARNYEHLTIVKFVSYVDRRNTVASLATVSQNLAREPGVTDEELTELLHSLQHRVLRLEDIEQIKQLHRTYIRQLADRDWGDMVANFTADALMDLRSHGPRRGHDEIAKLFERMHTAGNPHDGYVLSSPVIDVDGDSATGVWTWHRHLCEFPVMGAVMRVFGPWWEGRYHCTYRREDGRWKFATMHFRLVSPDPDLEPEDARALAARGETVIMGAGR